MRFIDTFIDNRNDWRLSNPEDISMLAEGGILLNSGVKGSTSALINPGFELFPRFKLSASFEIMGWKNEQEDMFTMPGLFTLYWWAKDAWTHASFYITLDGNSYFAGQVINGITQGRVFLDKSGDLPQGCLLEGINTISVDNISSPFVMFKLNDVLVTSSLITQIKLGDKVGFGVGNIGSVKVSEFSVETYNG